MVEARGCRPAQTLGYVVGMVKSVLHRCRAYANQAKMVEPGQIASQECVRGVGFNLFCVGVSGLGFGVWGLGFWVWVLGFGVWDLGFGVWGFGVWVLGFGVWD